MVRLDDLDDQLHDGFGRVEDPALLPLLHGEVAEEVFVDLAEGVAGQVDGGEKAQQLDQHVVAKVGVGLRQSAGEVGVVLLDGLHRFVDGLADVVALSEALQVAEPRLRPQEDDPFGVVVGLADLAAVARADGADALLSLCESLLSVSEKNQTQDRRGELARLEARIRPELVCSRPQPFLNITADHTAPSGNFAFPMACRLSRVEAACRHQLVAAWRDDGNKRKVGRQTRM